MKQPSNRTWRRRIKQQADEVENEYFRWVGGVSHFDHYNSARAELDRLLRLALPDPPKKGAKKR